MRSGENITTGIVEEVNRSITTHIGQPVLTMYIEDAFEMEMEVKERDVKTEAQPTNWFAKIIPRPNGRSKNRCVCVIFAGTVRCDEIRVGESLLVRTSIGDFETKVETIQQFRQSCDLVNRGAHVGVVCRMKGRPKGFYRSLMGGSLYRANPAELENAEPLSLDGPS
jgi:hypothetical protein